MSSGAPTWRAAASRLLGWRGLLDTTLLTVCLGSVLVVLVGGFVQITYGAYTMSPGAVWRTVFDPDVLLNLQVWEAFLLGAELPEAPMDDRALVVWNIRVPRVVVAVLVGANLAVSGAIFQAVTRNELASPFILGVSSGAGLTILLSLVFLPGTTIVVPLLVGYFVFDTGALLPLYAALGGVVAFLLVYAIAWNRGTSPVRLVLAGVIVNTVFQSLQSALYLLVDDLGSLRRAIAWMTGTLTGADWEQVRLALPWTVLALALALLAARQLNVLLLGEETATSLGMRVERVRFALSGVAVLAAAASIAVAGIVGFLGLIVPHVVRNVVGSDHRKLLIGCAFVGPALMVAADVVARLALSPMQLPAGVVTGLIGGPYFLYIMRKQEALGEL